MGALVLALASVNQVLSLIDPLLFRHIIDSYATHYREHSGSEFLGGVGILLTLAVAATLTARLFATLQAHRVDTMAQQVGARMYADGIKHSLELPYTHFEDQRSGETLGKLEKMRTDVERFIVLAVNMVFTALIGVLFVTIYAFLVNWVIGSTYLLLVPFVGGLCSMLSRKIKITQTRIVRERAAFSGSATESLRNIELVKSLGLTEQEIARLNATTARILNVELEKAHYLRYLRLVHGISLSLVRLSIRCLLLYLVFTQRISIGQFFSLLLYSFMILGPLQELGDVINVYRETEVSLQNFKSILDQPTETRLRKPAALGSLERLVLDDVSFQHHSAFSPAVRGVSLEVFRGETIALVGPSGAGKTTLVKLLVGLYPPRMGHIYYNGIPENEIAMEDLRKQVGLVTQDTQLFSGSIRENLTFARPGATDIECLHVVRQASLQDLLDRANCGLDTVIGEGGMKISGGERQRLSIARALLRRPHLLIFDEATSSLDSLTEDGITKTIRDIASHRDAVTILIAHRLSTVLHADRIYVLERGQIVEFGRHAELVAANGLYSAMWRQQVGERNISDHPTVLASCARTVDSGEGSSIRSQRIDQN